MFPVKFRDRITGAIEPPAASLRVRRFSHMSRYEESVRYLGNVASADAVGGGARAYHPKHACLPSSRYLCITAPTTQRPKFRGNSGQALKSLHAFSWGLTLGKRIEIGQGIRVTVTAA
jgi:hypothetical protein